MRNETYRQPQPTRKDIRLKNWNYSSAGAYHATVCTSNKTKLFGRVIDTSGMEITESASGNASRLKGASVELSEYGKLCLGALEETARSLDGAHIDTFVIMPNHVHMLVSIAPNAETSLGAIVGKFKSLATKRIHEISPKANVWQRGYYDHIIRDESDYNRTWEYIENNPARWLEDAYCM